MLLPLGVNTYGSRQSVAGKRQGARMQYRKRPGWGFIGRGRIRQGNVFPGVTISMVRSSSCNST